MVLAGGAGDGDAGGADLVALTGGGLEVDVDPAVGNPGPFERLVGDHAGGAVGVAGLAGQTHPGLHRRALQVRRRTL